MAGSHKLFILQLHNLLPIFIVVFGIWSSWDNPKTLTEAMEEEVGRRELSTDNNPGFISIDCGVDEDYLNNKTGIYYKSDKDFINTGENRKILSRYGGNELWREDDTLRSFAEGKRNCYTLKLEQGQNNYYAIRASFLYGNYDGKDKIPRFDLYLGADRWTTVELSLNLPKFYEILYFFSADTEYLCLVNTGSGIPFISTLELRPSKYPFYDGINHVALHRWVYDLGFDSNGTARYRDDVYDRIWHLRRFPGSVPIGTALNVSTQGSNGIPVEVLRTAIKPDNSFSLNYSRSDSSDSQYHLLLHFAEVEDVAQNQLREFSIYVNGLKISERIRLQYLNSTSVSTGNGTIRGDINITLDATPESDLPPILNAMEFYEVLHFSSSATDQFDGTFFFFFFSSSIDS
ncbi:hypothetical protein DITRI_Ditri19aG0096200 [Diplodiscus trichospermus]